MTICFGDEPLFSTYMQLQMTDQSIRFLEEIAKDIMVKIQDYYVPADLMILDIGEEEEEEDIPIILGRPLLNTTVDAIPLGILTSILPTTDSGSKETRRPMMTLFKEGYLWITLGL